MSRYHRLRFRVSPENEELLSAWLWSAGTEGIEIQSGETVRDLVLVSTFRCEKLPVKEDFADLELRLPGVELVDSGPVEETDWLAAWRDAAVPIELGERLLVDPREWEPSARPEPAPEEESPGGRFVLRIPARTAFGVGSHESTRLAYELLEATPLAGKRVLDVGCGSGILAMAAIRLGATSAIGFDFDPAAALLAGQYARHNEVTTPFYAGTIAALAEPDANRAAFDVVVLNVLPHEIAEELGEVVARLAPGGELLVSGVLRVEAEAVERAISKQGCDRTGDLVAGEWIGLRFEKRPGVAREAE